MTTPTWTESPSGESGMLKMELASTLIRQPLLAVHICYDMLADPTYASYDPKKRITMKMMAEWRAKTRNAGKPYFVELNGQGVFEGSREEGTLLRIQWATQEEAKAHGELLLRTAVMELTLQIAQMG